MQASDVAAFIGPTMTGLAAVAVSIIALARNSKRQDTESIEQNVTRAVTVVLLQTKVEILDKIDAKLDRYALREYVDQAMGGLKSEVEQIDHRVSRNIDQTTMALKMCGECPTRRGMGGMGAMAG